MIDEKEVRRTMAEILEKEAAFMFDDVLKYGVGFIKMTRESVVHIPIEDLRRMVIDWEPPWIAEIRKQREDEK